MSNLHATPIATEDNSSRTKRAMFIMIIAMLLAPVMDSIAKYLALEHDFSPASVTLYRFVVQSILTAALLIVGVRGAGFKAQNPFFNILRGLLIGAASMLFFVSVKYMPIADAISVFFVEPMMVMVLSAIFLREKLGWRRMLAALVGFCGALLIIQPSFEAFGAIALLPLATAFLFSIYLLLTRRFGANDQPLTMQFYAGLGGVIWCSSAILVGEGVGSFDFSFAVPNTSFVFAALIAVGVIATATHLMVVVAFSNAPVTTLAPFQYLEIVSATVLGYFLFSELPNFEKWIGIIIIVASGWYIFYRENLIAKQG